MNTTPIITPRFALIHISDELDRAAEAFSFVIEGLSTTSDGARYLLMGLRDKLESISEYAIAVTKAQNGGEGQ